ncbi:MAG: T9SS type A sorting domain-containing protein [Bacteroidota bacterium]|nr:T9SS type A sorting domain-containing protein [Bacteroidota bacterium]
MKKIFNSFWITILFIQLANTGTAQVSVSGSTSCNTTYSTLKGACDCLNSNSQSGNNITVSLTGNTSEAATVSITGASGMWNSLTMKPSGGAARSITASSLNAPLIQINGGDKVKIDGLNSGSNSLTLDNPSTNSAATSITFSNDATYDTVRNCTIKGSCTSTTGIGTITFDQASGSSGNDYCYIGSCLIGPSGSNLPVNPITAVSNTTSSDYITIANCEIYNYFSAASDHAGIYIYTNGATSNWTISGNSFYQTASRTFTGSSNEVSAVRINGNSNGNGYVLSGNYFGGTSASCGGTAMTYTGTGVMRAFRLSVASATATSIQNNLFRNISFTSSSASTTQSVMSLVAGAFDVGSTTGNTIGESYTTNSVSISLSNTAGVFSVIAFSTGTTLGNSIITNNNITGISLTSSTGILKGIWLQGSTGVMTVSRNTIGGSFLSNAINSASNNTAYMIHATNSASGQHTISGNYIYGITATNTGTSNIVSGILTSGTGSYTISGNNVENFYSSSRAVGSGSSSSLIVISATSTGNNDTISGNSIHDIYGSAPSQAINVLGLHCNFGSATGCAVAKNNIYSFSIVSTSASATVMGINIAGGTTNYYYNAVQMGIVPSGLDNDLNCVLYGVNEGGGTNNFYHNTLWMGGGGSTSGSAATYTFYSSVTVNTRVIKNNIFVNNRKNGSGGSGTHTVYRISSANPTGLTSDYNVYYSSSIGIGGRLFMASATAYTSIKAFREAMYNNSMPIINDLHSGVGNPNIVSADNGSCCVDLHIQSTTPCEGMGIAVGISTTDYEGDTLSSKTPTDIGADAGTFTFDTGDDIFTPTFSFTSLASTSLTSNRIVTVNITDQGNGIVKNPSGDAPRIWWRRSYPSTSSWFSKVGTSVSGNANNAVYNFTIDYAANSITPAVGDSFAYYIVAMDSITGNIWYSSFYGASHSNPSTQTSAPTLYTAYKIVNGISGNYNIGTGQTYTTLTGAAGFFNFVNNNAVTGQVTATIISDLAEDGTNGLNEFLDDGGNIYKITIQSDGTLRTISNSANLSNKMIRINGADRVIIDGGSKKLKFRNTHSTAASGHATIMYSNGAISDTLRNCIIECNSTQSNNAIVYADVNGTNRVYIASNQLRSPTGGTTNFPSYGFLQRGTSYVNLINNEIFNWTLAGIYYVGTTTGNTISGNSIYDTAALATSPIYGIQIDDADSFVISGNYIGGSAASCGGSALSMSGASANFYGIYYNSGVDANNYCYTYSNTIQNISMTGTTSPLFYGIYALGGKHMIGNTSGSGNTIGHAATSGSIAVGGSTANPTVIGINVAVSIAYATSISSNLISNISVSGTGTSGKTQGISFASSNTGTTTDTIQTNTISSISTNGTNTAGTANGLLHGIVCASTSTTAAVLINNNIIYNLSSTTLSAVQTNLRGIGLYSTNPTISLKKNRIYGLTNTATSGSQPTIAGVLSTATSSTINVENNQLYLKNASNTNDVALTGIGLTAAGSQTQNIYYNTLAIDGSQSSGSASTIPLSISGASITSKSYNNILYNKRSGGSGNHLATGIGASGTANKADYNLYISDGTNMGIRNGTTYTFSNWKTATGYDQSSWNSNSTTIPSDSLFSDAANGNLNIRNDRTQCWAVNGKGIAGSASGSINSDFAGESRLTSFGFGTDIGSDEFNTTLDPPNATASGSPANSTTTTYSWLGRTIGSITWGVSGTVPSNLNVKYYSGATPPNPTQSGTRPNAKYMNCYWHCLATGGAGYTYNISLNYDSSLIGSVKYSSERRLKLAKKTDTQTTNWAFLSSSSVDTGNNILSVNGLSSFSFFAATDSGNSNLEALPVEWLSLTAEKNRDDIYIKWNCLPSVDDYIYIVQYSSNGIDFITIAEMPQALSPGHTYTFKHHLDYPLLEFKGLYYRVVAKSIHEALGSPIRYVQFESESRVSVYPQPASNYMILSLPAIVSKQVIVSDACGRIVYNNYHTGNTSIDVSTWFNGIYIMYISDDKNQPIKISINK